MPKQALYIGLMSGTSADGVDLALVDFSRDKKQLISSYFLAYPNNLREKIISLYLPNNNEIDLSQTLNIELAYFFADAIKQFLNKININANQIIAIGNHGQTIRHRPSQHYPFTLQIGCNQTLSSLTHIRVIGDFRQKDMVYGGQGAPLVPAFHQTLFSSTAHNTFVVNMGGIANITYLPKDPTQAILGFDTGPGNSLLDAWYSKKQTGSYDKNGAWAAKGQLNNVLLTNMLSDDYFHKKPPKSTGREYFHLTWLEQYLFASNLHDQRIKDVDVQTSLTYLTAKTISDDIKKIANSGYVYLCGGGTLNKTLVKFIRTLLADYAVKTTSDIGIDSDALEAMAFAWLAYAFDYKLTGNVPSVTGANKAVVLGIEYCC